MSYRTEQEQIEIFRQWWRSSGLKTLGLVGLVAAGYVAWSLWNAHQVRRSEAASEIYEELVRASTTSAAGLPELADRLRGEYSDTFYGQATLLFLAKEAANRRDYAGAEQQLDELIRTGSDKGLIYTARLRSARALHEQGKSDEALARLEGSVPDAFKPLYEEMRGDIYLARNEVDKARQAYLEAKKTDEKGSGIQQESLDMKLGVVGGQP